MRIDYKRFRVEYSVCGDAGHWCTVEAKNEDQARVVFERTHEDFCRIVDVYEEAPYLEALNKLTRKKETP